MKNIIKSMFLVGLLAVCSNIQAQNIEFELTRYIQHGPSVSQAGSNQIVDTVEGVIRIGEGRLTASLNTNGGVDSFNIYMLMCAGQLCADPINITYNVDSITPQKIVANGGAQTVRILAMEPLIIMLETTRYAQTLTFENPRVK